MNQEEEVRTRQGVLLAIAAYTMWGIAPIYFKTLENISAFEILSHRVIWSFVLLALLLQAGRHWSHVISVLKQPKRVGYLLVTSTVIGANWLLFIWAITNDHMLDASLGYYINPLINVLFGMMFLSERLRAMQWWAVLLAFCGVMVQLIVFGSVPVVAIALAFSFGLYGLLRKKVAIDAQTGLFIETLLMLPAALIYLNLFASSASASLTNNPWSLNLLLVTAGIVTTLPLLCFTGAATRLKLSTLGFFQYIGPSLMFLLAVLLYGEPFTSDKAITFAFIWGALALFSFDALNQRRKRHQDLSLSPTR
ncbi:EamA family transporter RarD [Vibrio sp. SM6]|uniref:EamA family transporter RarD n=1 Tax=Vibrio agarilyticus TaxID=2726741 RepID=A0A7X8YIU6_9VIBR|nr:EamA family transporter RarD [Vibrio agarilyticus]NLS14782.1 EamA family transporter RarD [Vibrio agarilyticus]